MNRIIQLDPALVTGAPGGAVLFVDGVQTGQVAQANRPQVLVVAPGTHVVEVKIEDTVVYRENTYIGPGEQNTIRVLSGASRN